MEAIIRPALDLAAPRPSPDASREDKKNYAERLSRAIAQLVADSLRADFPGVLPDPEGKGHESRARSAKGYKKLDVNYSTPELGLGLGVSVKTLNFRDPRTRRYTKNVTRIDNELRAEAVDYHRRQPFAILIGLVFLPVDACDDGGTHPSSFGHAVQVLRHRTGRRNDNNHAELFERIFVALYEPEGERRGGVTFFDASKRPPRTGRPDEEAVAFTDVLAEIRRVYDDRNAGQMEWADASEPAFVEDEEDDDL